MKFTEKELRHLAYLTKKDINDINNQPDDINFLSELLEKINNKIKKKRKEMGLKMKEKQSLERFLEIHKTATYDTISWYCNKISKLEKEIERLKI